MQDFLRASRARLGPFIQPVKRSLIAGLNVLGTLKGEGALVRGAQQFWQSHERDGRVPGSAHYRNADVFSDDEHWLKVGRQHLDLYRTFARALDYQRPLERVLEWGCGGGANAVHFAPLCREFVGVDVAQATLDECGRQVAATGGATFRPVLIEIKEPEAIAADLDGKCDLFLSTYVFELIPSKAYGLRLLSLVSRLLAPGAMAIIQIKYPPASGLGLGNRWSYSRDLANTTFYRVEEFWTECVSLGLSPQLVHLVPEQPLVNDGRYAYFCLLNQRAS